MCRREAGRSASWTGVSTKGGSNLVNALIGEMSGGIRRYLDHDARTDRSGLDGSRLAGAVRGTCPPSVFKLPVETPGHRLSTFIRAKELACPHSNQDLSD